MREALPTAVGVNELRVDEADFEIVQHGWLVEVAERCEVILAHQDVRVSQVRQVLCFGVQEVLEALRIKRTCNFFTYFYAQQTIWELEQNYTQKSPQPQGLFQYYYYY